MSLVRVALRLVRRWISSVMSVAESSCAKRSSSMRFSSSAIGCSNSRKVVFIGWRRILPLRRRVGFDPVAAGTLAGVERAVGPLEERAHVLAGGALGDADGDGEAAARRQAGKLCAFYRGAQALGDAARAVEAGAGQDQQEFF